MNLKPSLDEKRSMSWQREPNQGVRRRLSSEESDGDEEDDDEDDDEDEDEDEEEGESDVKEKKKVSMEEQ